MRSIALMLGLALCACGVPPGEGAGGGAGEPAGAAIVAGPRGVDATGFSQRFTSPMPVISGFDLPVKQGSWWKFRTVADDGSWNGSTSTGLHTDTTFVLVLDAPADFGGETWYPVRRMATSSNCSSSGGTGGGSGTNACTPEPTGGWGAWSQWRYLSFEGRRIRGSNEPGSSATVLFDALSAIWPSGSGMFGGFYSGASVTEVASASGSQWRVQQSIGSQNCGTVVGYGVLCGEPPPSETVYELYDPQLGCVESGSSLTIWNGAGNTSKSIQTTLLDSSVAGDRAPPAT